MTTLRYFILSANSGQHVVLRKDFRLNLGYSLACGAVVLYGGARGPEKAENFNFPPPSFSLLLTVAIPSIQIAFFPLYFAAVRIKDGSYNFH